jgi:Protein of unknown function (DUF2795)
MSDNNPDRLRTDPDLVGGYAGGAQPGATGDTDADPDRRELRAEIGKYVSLASFPTTAGELADGARSAGASEPVLNALVRLAPDTRMENARDLWIALDLESDERF